MTALPWGRVDEAKRACRRAVIADEADQGDGVALVQTEPD